MFIGVDPGKKGGFCLLDRSGEIVSLDVMPIDEGGISSTGISQLYHRYRNLIGTPEPPRVYIEKIFTPPTDAATKSQIRGLIDLYNVCEGLVLAHDGHFMTSDHLRDLEAQLRFIGRPEASLKVDGRVGLLSYARGAGLLEMCAIWDWPITRVPPQTWMKKMKLGADRKLDRKAQSCQAARSLWPKAFDPGNTPSFIPPRCRKPHDGLVEAALIAEFGRKY